MNFDYVKRLHELGLSDRYPNIHKTIDWLIGTFNIHVEVVSFWSLDETIDYYEWYVKLPSKYYSMGESGRHTDRNVALINGIKKAVDILINYENRDQFDLVSDNEIWDAFNNGLENDDPFHDNDEKVKEIRSNYKNITLFAFDAAISLWGSILANTNNLSKLETKKLIIKSIREGKCYYQN